MSAGERHGSPGLSLQAILGVTLVHHAEGS
jgi:hypothetical protein